MIQHYLFSFEP